MFAYCNNNPVNNYDAQGTEPVTATAVFGTLCVVAVLLVAATYTVDKLCKQVQTWVIQTSEEDNYRGESVYVLRDKGNSNLVQYVGRTNDPIRRQAEHQRDPKHPERQNYSMKVVATGLKYDEARLLEQTLISAYSLAYLDNARREISKKSIRKFDDYIGSALNILKGAAEDELRALLLN